MMEKHIFKYSNILLQLKLLSTGVLIGICTLTSRLDASNPGRKPYCTSKHFEVDRCTGVPIPLLVSRPERRITTIYPTEYNKVGIIITRTYVYGIPHVSVGFLIRPLSSTTIMGTKDLVLLRWVVDI